MWSLLWSLKLPNKIKIFIWRAFHDIIPTTLNLARCGIHSSSGYFLCQNGVESSLHATVQCEKAKGWWSRVFFWLAIFGMLTNPYMMKISSILFKQDFSVWRVTTWFLWFDRHTMMHKGNGKLVRDILEDVTVRYDL